MSINDSTIIHFGKYKGEKLANVPGEYLLYLYENGYCYPELCQYIKDNLDVIKSDINYKNKSKKQ
jgi:uncharacterized protein (DUF3820 family)